MSDLTERQRYYKAHLEAAAAEGLSIARYARTHGLSAPSLYDARRRIQARSGFVRVRTPAQPGPSATVPVQIRLPNGVVVSIGGAMDEMAALLRAAAAL